jgi:4-amino-4-deoxy-L-arabinose transferase-like glycosyltransferase
VVLLALISGVLLATVKEIRTEPVVIAGPLLLVYLTIPKAAVKLRSLAVGLFVCALLVTSSLWGRYWDSKLQQATDVVASVGGHVLPEGIRQAHHELWHPIWCGLGDFGTDKGFRWLDTAAYAQAIPILHRDFGMTLNWSGGYFLNDFYDERRIYQKKISEIPEYHQVIKEIVQDTIRNDPVWYAGILWKRFNRILTDQTPIRMGVGGLTVLAFTYHGGLAILLLIGVIRYRRWPETKFLILSAAPSLTPLLIFSGKGATYYSSYHIVAAAIGIAITVDYVRTRMRGSGAGAPVA